MVDSMSQDAESFEMLKALYDFTAVYPKTISFDEGEYFILHQTSARQRNWWQVVSMKGNIGFVPSNYVMKLKVNPLFLNGFLESSIESLRLSTEKEINGIIGREELISRLVEKKRMLEKMLKYELTDSESEPPSPIKMSNGHLKQQQQHDGSSERTAPLKNGPQRHSPPAPSEQQQQQQQPVMMQTAKKSKSSPAVGGQVPPQFIQESPSTGVLATKHSGGPAQPEEQQQQTPVVVAVAAAAASQEPSSTLSELSSVSSEQTEPTSNNTATTGTLTTTSDEITAISRIDDRGGAGEEPSLGAAAPTEAENQTDHELNELETTNNDDVTVSETEPQPVSVREPPHDEPPQEEDEPVGPAEGAAVPVQGECFSCIRARQFAPESHREMRHAYAASATETAETFSLHWCCCRW